MKPSAIDGTTMGGTGFQPVGGGKFFHNGQDARSTQARSTYGTGNEQEARSTRILARPRARLFANATNNPDRKYYSQLSETDSHTRNLPHWSQGSVPVFATFRLADSMPAALIGKWKEEFADEWAAEMQSYLDSGVGECLFAREECRLAMEQAMECFNGARYVLHAYVVMPNHVHALVSPHEGFCLSGIVHSWKSFTANKINSIRGKSGTVWQSEYYDTLVRNADHYARVLAYIKRNATSLGGTVEVVDDRNMSGTGWKPVPPQPVPLTEAATGRNPVPLQPAIYRLKRKE